MAYADNKPDDVSKLATLIKQALQVKDSNTLHNNNIQNIMNSTKSDLTDIWNKQRKLTPQMAKTTPIFAIKTTETPDFINNIQKNSNHKTLYQNVMKLRGSITSLAPDPNASSKKKKTLTSKQKSTLNSLRKTIANSVCKGDFQKSLPNTKLYCEKDHGLLVKEIDSINQLTAINTALFGLSTQIAGYATEQAIKQNTLSSNELSNLKSSATAFSLPKATFIPEHNEKSDKNSITLINAGEEMTLTKSGKLYKSRSGDYSLTSDQADKIRNYRKDAKTAITTSKQAYISNLARYLTKAIITHKLMSDDTDDASADETLAQFRLTNKQWQQNMQKDNNPSSALVESLALLSEMRYEQMKTHQNNERKLMIEAINQSNVNDTILTQLNQIADQIQMKTTGHSAGQNTY